MSNTSKPARDPTRAPVTRMRLREQVASGAWIAGTARAVALLLVIEVGLFGFLFAGMHGWIVPLENPISVDFLSFYAAGRLSDQGNAIAAYNHATHFAMEQALAAPGISYQYFLYPPPFLLVCAALAWLPWTASFIAFEAITMAACMAVLRATVNLPARQCLVALIAFPAVPWVLLLGQNAFLTAALFGGALLLVDRRPVVAGLLIACLAGKPHLALLIPVALAAGGHWRAFITAAAGVLALGIITSVLFGFDIWPTYLASFAATQGEMQTGQVGRFAAMITPYAALREVGAPHGAAMLAQVVAAAAAACVVALLWRRHAPLPLRAAALLSGALVAIPFALFYDLMPILVALCWLVRHGRSEGFPRWSKSVLAICWLLPITPLVMIIMTSRPQLPVAALVPPAVLLLCWRWYASTSHVAVSDSVVRAPLKA